MQPMKNQGPWKLGLYQEEATPSEVVGTIRRDRGGRTYVYSRAGATALVKGKQTTAPNFNADWTNKVCSAAVAIGGKSVTLTITDVGTDTLPANYFAGGQLQIQDNTGEGIWYPIVSSTALTNGGTTVTVTLEDSIVVALDTTTEATVVPSPWMGTVVSATETHFPTGVPLRGITANYYYWSQTGGLGIYLSDSTTPAVGSPLLLSATDGALGTWVLDLDATADATVTRFVVAKAYGTAGVSGEHCPCVYSILN